MNDDSPKRVVSINLSSIRFYFTLFAVIIAVSGSLYAGITSLGKHQAESVMRPIIEEYVKREMAMYSTRNTALTESSLAKMDAKLSAIQSRLDQNSRMLEVLIKDRLNASSAVYSSGKVDKSIFARNSAAGGDK